MANSDKNILITPNTGSSSANPTIRFTGANNTPLSMRVLDSGTLSFEGTSGQLFSISDGLTGTIYSVNDISGMPSIELLDTGLLKLTQYSGSTVFGASAALQSSSVNSKVSISTAFAATPGLIVRGVTSQSANLQEWQNSVGTAIAYVDSIGRIFSGTFASNSGMPSAGGSFQATSSAGTAVVGRAASTSQTGDMVRLLDSVGTNIAGYNALGQTYTGSTSGILVGTGGATTAASGTSTTATITTTSAHGLAIGDLVTVAGVTPTGYNATASVTAVPSSTQFSYANTTTGSQTVAGTVSIPAQSSITARNAITVGLIVKGFTSQSADLAQWQNSGGSVLAKVNSSGSITAASYVTTGGTASQFVRGDGSLTTAQIPQNAQTSAYTAALSDVGKHISITTGGVTIPSAIFSVGDNFMIFNNSSSSQTITQGSGVTLRLSGTASFGNRTLSQYGLATVVCVATGVFVIAGTGLA